MTSWLTDSTTTGALQGYGTLAAVGVSLYVLARDGQLRRRITEQDLRAQARRLQVREPDCSAVEVATEAAVRHVAFIVEASVNNQSDETISDVLVEVLVEPMSAAMNIGGPLTDGWKRLNAGESRSFAPAVGIRLRSRDGAYVPMHYQFNVVVTFTDSAGNRWRREADHGLTLVHRAGANRWWRRSPNRRRELPH